MPADFPHNPFLVVPVEIIKISGTIVYFVSGNKEILSLDLSQIPISSHELKQYALSNINKLKIDAGGFVVACPGNDIDFFIPSDTIAMYAKPVPSNKLSAMLIKLYKDKRISKRFLAGNL